MQSLLAPITAGTLSLPNRLIMSPLTRCRAEPQHVPGELMVEYYRQRAGAGLIIAEATMVQAGNSAFWSEPGIHSAAQVAGWRRVTDAVHAEGGRIMLQLWHGGRACHPLMNDGAQPVAPSPIAIDGEVHTPSGKSPYVVPRELTDAELPGIVAAFVVAARNAREAGFDGVEVHGANGYLLDEFLRDGSNQRSGPWGGPIAQRARLLLEVVDAVIAEWGAGRVAVRISPLNSYNSMQDSDPVALTRYVARALSERGIAFLDFMRGDILGIQKGDVLSPARECFEGVLVGNVGYTAAEADAAIAAGLIDAVALGRPFISNPDLVTRLRLGAPLARSDMATWYTPGPVGYIDYPALALAPI
ncbi:MAG TPA: alkene reductase [Gammaproteobacteria bacterium]|nr:alkene reductase [Gammaproteobacteria bacterium]